MKKVIFYVLFAAVTFVVTLTILSQRLDSTYMIERDITMKAPISQIFTQIGDLKNWPNWNPWKKHDPTVEYIFDGDKTSAVGDHYSWKSAKSGSGTLTITESGAPNVFSYSIKFDDWADVPTGEFHLIDMGDMVKVVWTMRGNRSFTDKIFWTLFKAEDHIKADFDEGLKLLKELVESQPQSQITETQSSDIAEPAAKPIKKNKAKN